MNNECIRAELLGLISEKIHNVKLSDTGIPNSVEIIIRYTHTDVRLTAILDKEKLPGS